MKPRALTKEEDESLIYLDGDPKKEVLNKFDLGFESDVN